MTTLVTTTFDSGEYFLMHDRRICSSAYVLFRFMAERAAKLRRLEAFRRRIPHVTASALSTILVDIERHGLSEIRHSVT